MAQHEVVIVGAGPTGLAAACTLVKHGIKDVVVLEREPQAGGLPVYCGHGGFGWDSHRRWWRGPQFAQQLRGECERLGIPIHTHTSVTRLEPGGTLQIRNPEGCHTLAANRVLLATGTRETPRSARLIGGSRPTLGVMNTGALQRHVYQYGHRPFDRPLIVGSEWVSLSALLTCQRLGIAPVAMVEASPRPVAFRGSGWVSRLAFGVPLWCNTEVVAIHGQDRVEQVVLAQQGHTRSVACDGVVLTGQFVPENALLQSAPWLEHHPKASPNPLPYQLQDPSYFAAGNLVLPLKRSGQCYLEGRAVALAIVQSLSKGHP